MTTTRGRAFTDRDRDGAPPVMLVNQRFAGRHWAGGIVLAMGVMRGLAVFLLGVNPFDPIAFGGVALMLFGAAVAATYFPARRASRVDPVEALRSE